MMMTTEANAMLARRWFTEGWTGNLDLADNLFAADFTTNGKRVGPAGPKRNVMNRLTGFPDMQSSIEEQIALDDKVVTRVLWRGTHLGLYSGVPPTGKAVEVMALILWRFQEGKVVEDWTVADQFGLFQQLGVLPATLLGAQIPAPPGQENP
jgi:predicted ester cyclase